MMRFSLVITFLLAFAFAAVAQPKLVGHRGCRNVQGIDENTIESLRYAQNVPVDYVEFDVNLTADDRIIVFHGPKVPGLDKDIREISFKEARAVVLPNGGKMPTLREWFNQVKKHPDVKVVIEIKRTLNHDRDRLAVQKTMEEIKDLNCEKFVSYTTFSRTMCEEIHRIDPTAKVLFLQSSSYPLSADEAGSLGYNGISYNLDAWMNNPSIAERARELGIETTLWLANDEGIIEWAIAHKIDCISVDDPVKARKYLNGKY